MKRLLAISLSLLLTACAGMTQAEADAWARALNDVNRSAQNYAANQPKTCYTYKSGNQYFTQCY